MTESLDTQHDAPFGSAPFRANGTGATNGVPVAPRKGEVRVKVSVDLDESLHKELLSHVALRQLALEEQVSKSDVIREALRDYLDAYAEQLEKLRAERSAQQG